MAIKHIKNIQAKAAANDGNGNGNGNGGSGNGVETSSVVAAAARQCFQVDQYREGYHECLTTAVQFLIEISAHFEEICYKMVSHLREHFNDVVKGDHCPNSSSTNNNSNINNNNNVGNFNQIKRRSQENGSPPTTTTTNATTTSPLNGLGQFLLANGVGVTEDRSGGGASTMGPRLAHLCGSINGHSSSGSGGLNNGSGCGHEGLPSSSDGQDMVMSCAKDLSCRGANNSNNNKNNNNVHKSSAQAASTSTSSGSVCNGGSTGGDMGKHGHGHANGCGKAPQQTAVITSTACSVQSSSMCSTAAADLLVNVETESSSSALDHGCVMESSAVGSGGNGNGGRGADDASHLVKVHNLTDTSCDGVEHHYKYKNYMQQRFSHERYHDEHVVSNSSNELHDHHDDHHLDQDDDNHHHHHHDQDAMMSGGEGAVGACKAAAAANSGVGALLSSGGGRGSMAPPPVEPTDSNCSVDTFVAFSAKRAAAIASLEALKNGARDRDELPLLRDHVQAIIKEEKMDTSPSGTCEVAPRMVEGSQQIPRVKVKARFAAVSVPIFALHAHGAFYIPLTVDYDALVPYLGDVNLLDKNMAAVKALHPVNINIYAPF